MSELIKRSDALAAIKRQFIPFTTYKNAFVENYQMFEEMYCEDLNSLNGLTTRDEYRREHAMSLMDAVEAVDDTGYCPTIERSET